jgi:mannose-1-phosphate guanylyltransferase / phosphomannomutase
MKAVLMAGGEGSRLRPLTLNCPKPLVPIVNKPIMQHILELLKGHGVTEVVVTLHYLSDQIRAAFGDGSDLGMTLHYSVEDTPLGTAGSVKMAERLLRDDAFLIVSGDALTDMDLSSLAGFHREKGAVATLGLVRVSDPLEYGVVVTERDGHIRRFLEKPDWSEVFSDMVNTGIYCLQPEVFDLIPEGTPYDWSKDVFPQLLQDGKPIYGWLSHDYWCDVGSLQSYRQAQEDVLSGRVKTTIPGDKRGRGIWISPTAQVDHDAQIDGPALIGEGARVKSGAFVGEYSVIGNHCRIESEARVVNTTLWDGVYAGEGARLNGAIVGRNTTLGRGSSLAEGAVIGERCRLGPGSSVSAQVKIWPDKMVESGSQVTMSLVWGPRWSGTLIRDGAVRGIPNVEMTPDFATRLATAYGACLKPGSRVVTGRDGHPSCRMIKRAVIAGLMSAGIDVTDLHAVPEPVARLMARTSSAAGGLYIHMSATERGAMTLELFDGQGITVDRNFQRKVESIFAREDFRRADADAVGGIDVMGRVNEYYGSELLAKVDEAAIRKRQFYLVLDCAFGTASYLAPEILGSLGCRLVTVNGYPNPRAQPRTADERARFLRDLSVMVNTLEADLGAMIDEEGSALHLVDSSGRILADEELLAVFSLLILRGHTETTLVAPISAPSVLEQMAKQHHGKVVRTKSDERSLLSAAHAAPTEVQLAGDTSGHFIYPAFQCAFDGVSSLVRLLELLARQDVSLRRAADDVPPFYLEHRQVPCAWDRKGEVMRRLTEKAEGVRADFTDGIKLFNDSGWVLYLPDAVEPAFHVYAEAGDPKELEKLVVQSQEELAGMGAAANG